MLAKPCLPNHGANYVAKQTSNNLVETISAERTNRNRLLRADSFPSSHCPRSWRPRKLQSTFPALVTASPAAPPATIAAPVSTTLSAPTAAVASTAAGVFCFWPGFINVQSAPSDLRTVQGGNGFFSLLVAGHFHETKTARPPGVTVGHDADAIYLPKGFKHLSQFVLGSVKA
jgi:hypothetical protein